MIAWLRRYFDAIHVAATLLGEREALQADCERLTDTVAQLQAENDTLSESNRELAEANQNLEQQNLRLQDRLDGCLEDRKQLWEMVQESARGERIAYQMHINQAWQGRGAGTPYPEAPHLPKSAPQQEGGPMTLSQSPSQVIRRRTQDFVREQISNLK